ncbi:23S rRNA (guanosine(2251)-2'-O)-methyltransferase RlmB [Rhodovibrionaceae bacterium A322]
MAKHKSDKSRDKAGAKRHKSGPRKESRPRSSGGGAVHLFGVHAVRSAMENPQRRCRRLLVTGESLDRESAWLSPLLESASTPLQPQITDREKLEDLIPPGAVHQGLVLEVDPLKVPPLGQLISELPEGRTVILALDQVTDPHNVGAILRSAAAFGAAAVINTDRNAAQETGTLAKSACGGLEHVPYLQVSNLVRTLESLKKDGFWVAGFAGEAHEDLHEAKLPEKLVLCLGAEGPGLRRLTRETCDLMLSLPANGPIRDLNVSNAAAIALYELLGRQG